MAKTKASYDRIAALPAPVLDVVRNMLKIGGGAMAIADFIQQDAKQLTSVDRKLLSQQLSRYRDAVVLPAAREEALRKNLFDEATGTVKHYDTLAEVNRLYDAQLNRYAIIRMQEADAGQGKGISEAVGKEIDRLRKILEIKARVELKLGILKPPPPEAKTIESTTVVVPNNLTERLEGMATLVEDANATLKALPSPAA